MSLTPTDLDSYDYAISSHFPSSKRHPGRTLALERPNTGTGTTLLPSSPTFWRARSRCIRNGATPTANPSPDRSLGLGI